MFTNLTEPEKSQSRKKVKGQVRGKELLQGISQGPPHKIILKVSPERYVILGYVSLIKWSTAHWGGGGWVGDEWEGREGEWDGERERGRERRGGGRGEGK